MTDAEARALFPKPAVGQQWVDWDGDVITVVAIDAEGSYPVRFTWHGGTFGAVELDMRDFEPTAEVWAAEVARYREALERIGTIEGFENGVIDPQSGPVLLCEWCEDALPSHARDCPVTIARRALAAGTSTPPPRERTDR